MLVGIGEASYATITPDLLSDFFPPSKRNRILTIFYTGFYFHLHLNLISQLQTAIPVGAALGYIIGSLIASHWTWRYAFLVTGPKNLKKKLFQEFSRTPRHSPRSSGCFN
jgi:MFS family permease